MEEELTREQGYGTISETLKHAHWQHGCVLTLEGCQFCLTLFVPHTWIPAGVAFPRSSASSKHSASFFFSSVIKSHSGWTFPTTCRERSFS